MIRLVLMTRRATDILRIAILLRDGNTCVYCGAVKGSRARVNGKMTRVKMTVDHVTPKSWGGRDSPENMVCACERCNTIKATMDDETFAFMLKRHGLLRTRRELTQRVSRAVAKRVDLVLATKIYALMSASK